MPRIESIHTTPHDIPLTGALAWGKGHQLTYLRHVLVTVHLSDGASGLAEATPRPTIYGETQASVQAIMEQELAPRIIGEAIHTQADIHALDAQLALIKNNHTAKGALNMALHAALAQSQGQSLSAYLGAAMDAIRVSYIVGTGSDDVVHADVTQMYSAGVRVFKTKIGKDIPQEIALIARLQADFPDAEFYADANQCLSAENAAPVLDQLHEMGVLYCEEPLPVHDLRARAALCSQTPMPLIADDSAFTLPELQREIAHNTFDLLNIKTARTGFSQSLQMAQAARTAGKTIMVGSQASSLLGALHTALFASAIHADHATECTFFLKTDADLHHAPPLHDGVMRIADAERCLQLAERSYH